MNKQAKKRKEHFMLLLFLFLLPPHCGYAYADDWGFVCNVSSAKNIKTNMDTTRKCHSNIPHARTI